jgi:hypothetical protein
MPLWAVIVILVLGVALSLYRKWSERSALKQREAELTAATAHKRADRQPDGRP